MRIEHFSSIDDIPLQIWENFSIKDAVGLEANHLRAVEKSKINNLRPYYFIGYSNNTLVGIAYCFSIQVNLTEMKNDFPPDVLSTIRTWKPDFMNIRILEIGHIASLGSTIEVLPQYRKQFLNILSVQLDEIACIENADLCIIRDIPFSLLKDFCSFKEHGYHPVMGFPIARIPIAWNSFDEYVSALKAKKRNTIKQRRKKLQKSEIKVVIIEDYAPYAERLSELWRNVAIRNNGYSHEQLTPDFFISMSQHLKNRSHVVAIKRNEEIIAYGLNLIGDKEYFGVAEGLDYRFRDEYDLYANNIFESLQVACNLQKKIFNIGITTYDFKTSIGAELDPTIYFVKGCKKSEYTGVYAQFLQHVIAQPINLHRVFHNSNTANRIQPQEIESKLYSTKQLKDPFKKLSQYVRADTARSADIYPYYPVFESAQEAEIKQNNRNVIMLGTNSYLGLSTHPKIKEAMHQAIEKYGSGCSGSPLLNGTLDIHRQLEENLALFIKKEKALVFSTGYQTNLGVLQAATGRNDILIMDKRNHASLIDGAKLSGAQLVRYKHNDMDSLEAALQKYSDKPKLIVTDSLFSMEGTIIDLPKIVQLSEKYNARLMLDESHAIGVIGPTGRGVAEQYGLIDKVDIIMGTFSKACASIGGFIAGDYKLIDTLKHTSRSHIFSASLPPSAVAATLTALEIIDKEPERRKKLFENTHFFVHELQHLGYKTGPAESPIISVFCGHELIALTAYQKLFEQGVFVNPVTYPAVPKNHEILRISLMATHTKRMLSQAIEIFEKLKTSTWPVLNKPATIDEGDKYSANQ